jgi:hypothetical protein
MCEPISLIAGTLISAGANIIASENQRVSAEKAQKAEAERQKKLTDAMNAQADNAPSTPSVEQNSASQRAKLEQLRYGLASTIKTSSAGLPAPAPIAAPSLSGKPLTPPPSVLGAGLKAKLG